MAIQLIVFGKGDYLGLSTDVKPTTGVLIGSKLTETDTGIKYVFDGTGWRSEQLAASKAIIIPTAADGLSVAYYVGDWLHFAIEMSAAWTAANLTMQSCSVSGGTFSNVVDDTGAEVSIPVAAGKTIPVIVNALALAPLHYVKFRSGTSAVPVQQAAERTLTLICKR